MACEREQQKCLATTRRLALYVISDLWKRITRLQGERGLPQYSLLVFETRPGLHAHLIFLGNPDLVRRLRRSQFGEIIKIVLVNDPSGLTLKYLAKERTPQAGYGRGHLLGGRIKGSHRLNGGGDRVRLSAALERDAIDAGYVEPWQHTNAKRAAQRKPYRTRRLSPRKAPKPTGQLCLLPELERPVARFRAFGGGIVPPAAALEIEFYRQRRGLTQRQLGTLVGVSQGQIANALRGHDPLSAWAVNRLREILP